MLIVYVSGIPQQQTPNQGGAVLGQINGQAPQKMIPVTQKKLQTSHVAERKYSEQPRLTVGEGVENHAQLVEIRGSTHVGSNGAGKSAKGPGPNPLQ